MAKGIFIIGTDTNVGKTITCGGIMYCLIASGYNTCYFKPVSSGVTEENDITVSSDIAFVEAVSGFKENHENINPFRFKTPVSPHLASVLEGRAVEPAIILERYKLLKEKYDFLIVEGCGGLAVPLVDKSYMQFHLIKDLGLDCVLVARTGLGTINHTILTLSFAEACGLKIKGIIFNGYTGSLTEDDNIKTISNITAIPVLCVIPELEKTDVELLIEGNIKEIFNRVIDVKKIIEVMGKI